MALSESSQLDYLRSSFFYHRRWVCACLLSYGLTFGVIAVTRKLGWLDRSTVSAGESTSARATFGRSGNISGFCCRIVDLL